MTLNRLQKLLILVCLLFMFVYFRLIPIINQTIPYTYDQGRDFLKAEEIIRYKKPTLIGPTTGIMGIFHGAWWYYFLSIPYVLFQGNPLGYSFFIFLISLLQVLLFYYFLKKEFNLLSALIFLILVTNSPYFIITSFFAISSVLVLPFLLLLLYSTYQFLKTNKILSQFLIFLSLGFIFEAEVPFGIFIIPSYLITIIITKQIKKFFAHKKNVCYSIFGIIIPLLPRALFEIKHNFLQTRAAFNFLLEPHFYKNKSLTNVFFDRLNLFWGYYKSLFPDNNQTLAITILLLSVFGFFYGYKKLTKLHKKYLLFVSSLTIFLFLLSLFYRDNFWVNYYEGLPYFYLTLLSIMFYGLFKSHLRIIKAIPFFILILLSVLTLQKFYKDLNNKNIIPKTGLRIHLETINYLYEQNKNQEFCVRIYTPPVIPYTYDYLFNYYEFAKRYKKPKTDFVNHECWYIIEDDPYKFRIDNWRKDNIPYKSQLLKSKKTSNSVKVELWQEI